MCALRSAGSEPYSRLPAKGTADGLYNSDYAAHLRWNGCSNFRRHLGPFRGPGAFHNVFSTLLATQGIHSGGAARGGVDWASAG